MCRRQSLRRMKVLPPRDCALIPSLISGLHRVFSQGSRLLHCAGWTSSLAQSEPQDLASPIPGSCKRGGSLLAGFLMPGGQTQSQLLATQSQPGAGQTELAGVDHQAYTVSLLEAQPTILISAEGPNYSQPWLEATGSCFEHSVCCVMLTNPGDLVSMPETGQPQWVALFLIHVPVQNEPYPFTSERRGKH